MRELDLDHNKQLRTEREDGFYGTTKEKWIDDRLNVNGWKINPGGVSPSFSQAIIPYIS